MKATVLLVDDALFMRTLLKEILVDQGYEVIGEAENGTEGIEKYDTLRPDLTFLDVTMGDVNGIEAAKKIKAINPEAKLIICSAVAGQQAYLKEALEIGVAGVIAKPFSPNMVIQEVEKVLAGN